MNKDNLTGWEQENRSHFDDITVQYDNVRPDYPRELFADIFRYAGPGKNALEIGAGTGKATRPFLDAGYNVTAVEIGANMAAFLQERFNGYNFNVVTAPFEDAILEEGNYDIVYAATSFHWVDAAVGCPKVFRLLKNGGVFALFRYNTFPGGNKERNGAIQAVYDKYYASHYKSSSKPVKKSHDEQRQPAEIMRRFGFSDLHAYGFEDVTMKFYDTTRTFSADEYIAFLETLSDHMQLPDSNRAALYTGVREAIIKHDNHHEVEYIFQLYMGRKPVEM